MGFLKQKIIAIIGAISALLGSIGAAIAALGLCACILAPIFSIAGIISIATGFLSNNRIYLIVIGIVLLSVSFILYKKKRTCKIHKK